MRLGVSLRHRIQLTPTGDEPVIKTYVSVHILSGREKERVQSERRTMLFGRRDSLTAGARQET